MRRRRRRRTQARSYALARAPFVLNPIDSKPPMRTWPAIGLGVGGTVAVAATGAAIGAATAAPCNPQPTQLLENLFCGPSGGASLGTAYGLLASGALGAILAFWPRYRTTGITMAGITGSLLAIGFVKQAAAGSSSTSTPTS
jgi:hypothetical protein